MRSSKNNYKYIILVVLIIFFACKRNRNTDNVIPVIDIEKEVSIVNAVNLSEYCSDIKYIPLETDSNILVGSVISNTFKEYNNQYYYGCRYNKKCLVFDSDGNYIKSIGKLGRAGDEFSSIMDMQINQSNGDVIFYDWDKLVIYNNNGTYKKSISLNKIKGEENLYIGNFNIIGDYISLHTTSYIYDNPGIVFINYNGEKILSYHTKYTKEHQTEFETLDGNKYRSRTTLDTYFYNNLLNVVNPITDTIFCYTPELKKEPRYLINLGKYKMSANRSNKDKSIQMGPHIVYESDNLMIFIIIINDNKFEHYKPNSRMGYMLYDKKSGKTRTIPYNKDVDMFAFNNDIDNGVPFKPSGIYGNKLYQFIDAYKFIEYSKKYNSNEMKNIAASLTNESNPVIVVASLK